MPLSKKFNFSLKTTVTCLIIAAAMLLASYWQYTRHIWKKNLISEMESRLDIPSEKIDNFLNLKTNWSNLIFRKLNIEGEFDFDNEIILKNRRYNESPGVYLITPLKIKNSDKSILVNRGFIPLAKSKKPLRTIYQEKKEIQFTGLIKKSAKKKFFLAPSDKDNNKKRVDDWLRINIPKIQKQIPYSLLPVYTEIMDVTDSKDVKNQIIQTKSSKSELLILPLRNNTIRGSRIDPNVNYPVHVLDTMIPPGRHFGYIFEWASMAIMTLLIGLVLQFRR